MRVCFRGLNLLFCKCAKLISLSPHFDKLGLIYPFLGGALFGQFSKETFLF